MSVRRLADESVQPESFAFTKDNASWAEAKIKEYPQGRQQSAVIPLLFRAQEQEGWVSRSVIETVAEMLSMPYIRVLEVATFYTQFQLQPVGTKAHIQVCGTTPCMLRGSDGLFEVCKRRINKDAHHTNDDGTLSWEEVECAGACVNAPMITIGSDTYEDLTPEKLEEIIDAYLEGKIDSLTKGPQNGRINAAAVTGQTTLTEMTPDMRHADVAKASYFSDAVSDPAPTKPGRKRTVDTETAPAVEGPNDKVKVSEQKAEAEKADTAGEGAPLFDKPEAAADDLKMIAGIGPAIEKKLNDLGVTTFAQVAAFKKADVEQVEERLNFKGRIAREDWIKQAKALAKGGEAEYIRVFGKKPR